MIEPGAGLRTRSWAWRLLPWLVPLALILVGLLFVAAGLTDAEEPKAIDVAPANVRAVVTDNAATWAIGQVGPDVSTTVGEVVMVESAATGASTYRARAVIVRQDRAVQPTPEAGATVPSLAEADTSTVATCVLWDVDVTARTVAPVGALEIVRETGLRELTDTDSLVDSCAAVSMPS